MESFPWTYDQYQRYSVLEEFLKVFYAGERVLVLDVGGASPERAGRGLWLPLHKIRRENFYVTDLQFCRERGFVQGNGFFLPFKTGSFDAVSALDVIEHLAENRREAFIDEMARVSRSAVVLSAPFKDERVERAEDVLFDQIQELYGIKHHQLLEHKKYGLPAVEAIDLLLSEHFPARAGLAYGSLPNWLFSQSFKNLFLLKKTTGEIHSLFDRWLASCDQEVEFSPPFSRYFWLAAKDICQENLAKATEELKARLLKRPSEKPDIGELSRLTQAITQLQSSKNVSALVFCFGEGEQVEKCLNHLLTQKANFELEAAALDLSPGKTAGKFVRERFPAVRVFSPEKGEGLSSLLARAASALKGDYFLWISDGILLPQDSAAALRRLLEEAPGLPVLVPRVEREGDDCILSGKGKPPAGTRRRIRSALHGRPGKKRAEIRAGAAGWVFSECLFFRRESLIERDFSNQAFSPENIFLWASVKPPGAFLHCPEVVVHKKERRQRPE